MQKDLSLSNSRTKMEAAFLASSSLKRNKRYFDIELVNNLQQQDRVMRRRPVSSSRNAQRKINKSFSNSTNAFTQRLQKDIKRYKTRNNSQSRPFTSRTVEVPSRNSKSRQKSRSQKSIKGVGIGQYLSRQQYYKIRQNNIHDERLFNNFSLQNFENVHTPDISKGPQKTFDTTLKYINNNLEYETKKLYEDIYYKRTTMDCKFNYKKQTKQGRQYFKTTRSQNKAATELSPKAVKKALEFASKKPGPIDSFHMNSGRQLPCQLDNRVGTNLTSHWRNEKDEIPRPKVEYSVRYLKQKLQIERRQKLIESKHPHFERNEICDKKFFLFKEKNQ